MTVTGLEGLATSLPVICDYLFNLIDENQGLLGIAGLSYGDQDKLPVTPYVCVEPDTKTVALKGAQRQVSIELRAYIILYYAAVNSPQDNRRAADQLAEDIVDLIHTKRSLDGLVIHGMCTSVESGYSTRDRTLMRSSRITYEALSQELLPWTG